jgi:hypothetical protein
MLTSAADAEAEALQQRTMQTLKRLVTFQRFFTFYPLLGGLLLDGAKLLAQELFLGFKEERVHLPAAAVVKVVEDGQGDGQAEEDIALDSVGHASLLHQV